MGRLKETYRESFQAAYGASGIAKVSDIAYNYGAQYDSYLIPITVSSNGPGGILNPGGHVWVKQGSDQVLQIQNYCSGLSRFYKLAIDGVVVNHEPSTTTLFDGTIVEITNSYIKLKNIQSLHTIEAYFSDYPEKGVVYCVTADDGTCYTGMYRYAYYNLCGQLGSFAFAQRRQDIPADLIDLADQNCCDFNPPEANCFCFHQ
jgi:hypothetical protein